MNQKIRINFIEKLLADMNVDGGMGNVEIIGKSSSFLLLYYEWKIFL